VKYDSFFGGTGNEDDISASQAAEKESPRISLKNEHGRRKKSACREKSQGQKRIDGSIKPLAGGFIVSMIFDRKGIGSGKR
jgi:hypothetical protein